jgi:hypothetical protein
VKEDTMILAGIHGQAVGDEFDRDMVAAAKATLGLDTAVTWDSIKEETALDYHLQTLIDLTKTGRLEELAEYPAQTVQYHCYKDGLAVVDDVLTYNGRAIVPPHLCDTVLRHLHSAHQGVTQMTARASTTVFWPGLSADIVEMRATCESCDRSVPGHSPMPVEEPLVPSYPFQHICCDYCTFEGTNYLVMVDRFSGWIHVREAPTGSTASGTAGLLTVLRVLFATFGIPEGMSSDGGPQFKSTDFNRFLATWGVQHRLSSAYNPQSNGQAEVAVKSAKRLLRQNIGPGGSLDTDSMLRGLLQLCNTPEISSGLSPAMIMLGKQLKDTLPVMPFGRSMHDSDSVIAEDWKVMWRAKEEAMRDRLGKQVDRLDEKTH